MRRSLFAGIGVAAVFIFAACSPDQTRQEPLAPTDVGLAKGGGGGGGSQECAGSLASTIASQQKALFTKAHVDDVLDPAWTAIKGDCSTASEPNPAHDAMINYLQLVVDFRNDLVTEVDQTRGEALINHMASLIRYVDNATFTRAWTILRPSTLVAGTEDGDRSGGAAVLDPAGVLAMATFDGQAGVMISSDQDPDGPHLFTLDPSGCPATSLKKATDDCYNIQVYPPVPQWSPKINIGMCIHGGGTPDGSGPPDAAIIHGASSTYTEVLPTGAAFPWGPSFPSCVLTHSFLDGWLGREAGPLGRAVAKALDYLKPRSLLADDAGESGLGLFTSPFGGASTSLFSHDFDSLTGPDVGDALVAMATPPGYIQIQNDIPAYPGENVVVLSQAQGNCAGCPVFSLLGTRVNSTIAEDDGSYEVTWSSVQTKPNIKEAPFVVLNAAGAEIARLSYVTISNVNKLQFKYLTNVGCPPGPPGATCLKTEDVGLWTQNQKQDFKITVNLNTLGGVPANTVSISGSAVTNPITNKKAVNATSLMKIGYLLTGIDAGIIASDKWNVVRIPDATP